MHGTILEAAFMHLTDPTFLSTEHPLRQTEQIDTEVELASSTPCSIAQRTAHSPQMLHVMEEAFIVPCLQGSWIQDTPHSFTARTVSSKKTKLNEEVIFVTSNVA